jgi:hypothetical protein
MDDLKSYSTSTPLIQIKPELIRVVPVSAGVMKYYQPRMSKAVWRPAFGRKLGFLVMQDMHVLGLIFLATPVIRLTARDEHLFPEEYRNKRLEKHPKTGKMIFNYGLATKEYMDMSVCVAAQPVGWHWNLGKLMAMIAPTLGDFVKARYPENDFKGVTTTSLYGRGKNGTQYTRIYKFLGYTTGAGHEAVDDVMYNKMMAFLREHCPNCTPGCKNPLVLTPTRTQEHDGVSKEKWCTVPGCQWRKGLGDGANPRMRRIAAFFKALEYLGIASAKDAIGVEITKHESHHHGHKRGVWYCPATPARQRVEVIQKWYERWGLPRYEKTKNTAAPYQNGKDGEGYERNKERQL